MLSYLYDFLKYLWHYKEIESDTEEEENFLSEQLVELDIKYNKHPHEKNIENVCDSPNTDCFERTGKITFLGNNYALIDGLVYLELDECSPRMKLNDTISYLCYENTNGLVKVVRCTKNLGQVWGEVDVDEKGFELRQHTLIAQVDYRKDRLVYVQDSDIKFNLDDVDSPFVPIKGDWLEVLCQVQWDETIPSNITLQQVIKVISIKPLRKKVHFGFVTDWDSECGVCDRQIYFNKQCVQNGFEPIVGSRVVVEAIESDQGTCNWRSIRLIRDESNSTASSYNEHNVDVATLEIEKVKRLEITHPIIFHYVNFISKTTLQLEIVNNSDNVYSIHRWIVLSKKSDSQITVEPLLNKSVKIYPQKSFTFNITCNPKFFGRSREVLVLTFNGFQVKRCIEINIVDNMMKHNNIEGSTTRYEKCYIDHVQSMKKIRNNSDTLIPGVRPKKPPAFVSTRLGLFPIPEKVWLAVLGDSNQIDYTYDQAKMLHEIETLIPCLSSDLNIHNYTEKWHTLLYLEEVQENINMRLYDMSKVFLNTFQEYLSIEISDLSERRPSLMKGDKVIVKDTWKPDMPKYEGFIHSIKGNIVLMKFNSQFHEIYSGHDISIEFHCSRTVYRRCHQAIHMALTKLGPDILLPSRIIVNNKCQVAKENLNSIEWCNSKLNNGQKAAVLSILAGECRPLPYCIFGPPGTGKTITVVESILQILRFLPESRILVATPSNSAANLLTERLIQYKDVFSNSISRLIAHHLLESDGLPDDIKPFCATIDIARENTQKCTQQRISNGININCQMNVIGRHRVIVGTCVSLGTLAQIGLPKGHFTHIIVDEAGQATEPEIMIPLTFVDKQNGQIILAGDPLQLGPVVMSKSSAEFGLNESYLQRLLERFPYQKDYDAFRDHNFDQRLITLLTDNYRSLEEVLTLPSKLFYDNQLVSNLNRDDAWISNLINIVSDIFSHAHKRGGIFVYGIQGQNTRAEDSPSWYNPQEAAMILLFTCKLYKKNVTPEQIGIITPYLAQIKYIRQLFCSIGYELPKIGTVEEFQGQERPIILLSTVRSTISPIQEVSKHYLGFVNNPKRVNVALTRAQVAAVVFCNPHVLSTDTLWANVIKHAIESENYTGCDLPSSLQELQNLSTSD